MDGINSHGSDTAQPPSGNDSSNDSNNKDLFAKVYEKHPELDTNKDGKIDASELSDGLDKGKISLMELLSVVNDSSPQSGQDGGQGGGQGGGQQPASSNSAPNQSSAVPVDENGDGKIDAKEFMKAFDKNHDGKLSAQELEQGAVALGLGKAK